MTPPPGTKRAWSGRREEEDEEEAVVGAEEEESLLVDVEVASARVRLCEVFEDDDDGGVDVDVDDVVVAGVDCCCWDGIVRRSTLIYC